MATQGIRTGLAAGPWIIWFFLMAIGIALYTTARIVLAYLKRKFPTADYEYIFNPHLWYPVNSTPIHTTLYTRLRHVLSRSNNTSDEYGEELEEMTSGDNSIVEQYADEYDYQLKMYLKQSTDELRKVCNTAQGSETRAALRKLVLAHIFRKFAGFVLIFAFGLLAVVPCIHYYDSAGLMGMSIVLATLFYVLAFAYLLRLRNPQKEDMTPEARLAAAKKRLQLEQRASFIPWVLAIRDALHTHILSLTSGIYAHAFIYVALVLVTLIPCALLCAGFYRACVQGGRSVYLTTYLGRSSSPSLCPDNQVCHVYLTLPEFPDTQMIVQYHTAFKPESSYVLYDTVAPTVSGDIHNNISADPQQVWKFRQGARYLSVTSQIQEEERYVHTADLQNLAPNTTYYLVAVVRKPAYTDDTNSTLYYSRMIKFRTLPSSSSSSSNSNNSSTPVRFVSGGDILLDPPGSEGDAKYAEELADNLIKHEPHFVAIGGDIGYANGFCACYRKWDEFINYWEQRMLTPTNYTVPMLLGIGNHEAYRDFGTHDKDLVPFFIPYFSFKVWGPTELQAALGGEVANVTENGIEVPGLSVVYKNTETFHYHRIAGHSSFVVLDTDVVSTYEDQMPWLRSVWDREALVAQGQYQSGSTGNVEYDELVKQHNATIVNRFAMYHVPMYPSVRSYNGSHSIEARKNMLSVFDQHNVTLGFENHDHAFKRTKCLRNNAVVETTQGATAEEIDQREPSCTIYVGDGSMGPLREPSDDKKQRWYMQETDDRRHVYLVEADATKTQVQAMDFEGDIFDSFTILRA